MRGVAPGIAQGGVVAGGDFQDKMWVKYIQLYTMPENLGLPGADDPVITQPNKSRNTAVLSVSYTHLRAHET